MFICDLYFDLSLDDGLSKDQKAERKKDLEMIRKSNPQKYLSLYFDLY